MANFEAFRQGIKLSSNLLFLKSDLAIFFEHVFDFRGEGGLSNFPLDCLVVQLTESWCMQLLLLLPHSTTSSSGKQTEFCMLEILLYQKVIDTQLGPRPSIVSFGVVGVHTQHIKNADEINQKVLTKSQCPITLQKFNTNISYKNKGRVSNSCATIYNLHK